MPFYQLYLDVFVICVHREIVEGVPGGLAVLHETVVLMCMEKSCGGLLLTRDGRCGLSCMQKL